MLFVFDTNVLISAALVEGVCRLAFDIGKAQGIARSEETFRELAKTLEKPRLQKYLTNETKIDFLANFLKLSQFIGITEKIAVCRDPKDDMFLELAVSCQASALITRDGDLLSLHPFRGIPIVSVTNFIKLYS
ncbi:MAG: putative toxin-antitoxin system toxin component, PIN family [Cyclobacteriaceae bacterium]|nr:putative toxin-antitoxin system toxin component, PIN family [Cyclobacteriaceae bacterium]